ncbi:6-phosphogluconate dehydrogenase (decarboxylating) [Candidatus Gottesmanbacteria bacterium CG11_big_fil_rev_8_21_14_0_20_37_11]|uniref:6-phosphogluconate dehydrogenase (Decarboxylating) n=3 Tax=Candidatus Gottesmaniibacteriota TaxID=1752720 RepID=A0A2M7RQ60_9BACT|nr:MAG: 6-phosphogluconate dehydrogenase (decarboxylating) [Candidatus Gottesmanbacteria bacterium CG1_02_37_22]PIP33200.1 MAG: 6-phosphogluconate dehydrogenase (decarboxylating) [Candidatus Gottesmanbacteria bacterium CG23_combo_of_CG06-09_8_20_14_all_37_19]PIR08989.1 MAG: 6-phosphogluconate dehydrogenase (decarboxylating) [Candidatus Gottesmanbacteria bacterium CG11_big_fil_rev_8_21_14_0_20_37_11]PIZ02310.1 MAG: 6-phosphogluconate dehydrogenase (decarboxylating) [Candidatus Gottesmanbacteria b
MKIGFVGLGKMGKAIVLHLLEEGLDVVVYNRTQQKVQDLQKEYEKTRIKNSEARIMGKRKNISLDSKFMIHDSASTLESSKSISDFLHKIKSPRIIWLMVLHGRPVDEMISKLLESGLKKGDILIDGGNSYYLDTKRRFKALQKSGIHYLDAGTSGGLEGARNGACLMIGGEKKIFDKLTSVFRIMSGKSGTYSYFGESGAGHFVKMVHNGVEYGMLQAIGEGFELLAKGPYNLNLHEVAKNWTKGSVVRGWLMDLLLRALEKDSKLLKIEGVIGGGETGEWTLKEAKKFKVSMPVLSMSTQARKNSLAKPNFSGKVIAALRNEFGGHEITKTDNREH